MPVTLLRKPLEGTVADTADLYGSSGLAMDPCRIPTTDRLGGGGEKPETTGKFKDGWRRPWMTNPEALDRSAERVRANVAKAERLGRYPANVLVATSEDYDPLPRYFKVLGRPGK